MPELPEVESARAVPGEIRHALLGGELISAMRRGKSMWCQLDPGGRR